MKTFLVILVLLFSSSVFAYEEMYYCSDIEAGGFHNRGSGYELLSVTLKKFKIKIDFSKKTIDSKNLGMEKGKVTEAKCQTNIIGEILTCSSAYGEMFTINTKTFKYAYASIFGNLTGSDDTMWVSYGTCEEF